MLDIQTRMKRAILQNDLLLVKRLCIKNPICLQYVDSKDDGNTFLHLAVSLSFYGVVVALVEAGHEDGGISKNYEGQTPLMVAAKAVNPAAEDIVYFLASKFDRCIGWRDQS